MEYFIHSVWLITSIKMAWILTVTSPSKAFLLGQSSSPISVQSPPSFLSLSLRSGSMLATGKKGIEKCCENDGLCVMGVFCFCKKEFYGFKCEFKKQGRPCGQIQHLQWARVGCNLCRCIDSNLTCLPHVYNGCDNKPTKGKVDMYEYQDDMTIFPLDNKSRTTRLSSDNINVDYYYYYDDDGDETIADVDEDINDRRFVNTNSASSRLTLVSSTEFCNWILSVCVFSSIIFWQQTSSTDTLYIT